MKNLLLVLIAAVGISGCAAYVGRTDTPYYHYSCVDHCDTVGGCRTTCGNHYYTDGTVYYYDADHHKWDGHATYQTMPARHEHIEHAHHHRTADEINPHDRQR